MPIKTFLPKVAESVKSIFGGGFSSNYQHDEEVQKPRRGEELRFDRFATELPYAQMEDTDRLCAIMAPDQRTFEGLGYVIEIQPQTGCTEQMAKNLELLFGQGLPEDSGVQVSLFGSPYVKLHTDIIRNVVTKDGDQTELMHSIAAARADMLDNMAAGKIRNGLPQICEQRCWISVVIPTKDPFDPAIREKVLNHRKSHYSILQTWHLCPWIWNRQALITTVSQILNPHRLHDGSWQPFNDDPFEEPRNQCVFRDTRIDVRPEGILFDSYDSQEKVLAVSRSANDYDPFIGLSKMYKAIGHESGTTGYLCPFLITTYATVGNYDKLKAKAELKSARAEQLTTTEIARFIPDIAEAAKDWRYAVKSFEGGEGLLSLTHQVMLFPKEQDRHMALQKAKAILAHAGIKTVADDYMHLQALLLSLPMTGGPLMASDVKLARRSTTKTASNAANTLPVLGDWKGTGPRAGKNERSPLVTLVSRRGQLLFVDPFANPNGNYNGIVVGGSGSGKSVMCNELAMSALRTGSRVWIIDVGRSYEKLCSVVGGQWIELSDELRSDGQHDCLNPFSLVRNIDEDMDMITPLIAQMISPSKPLTDLELTHLQIHFKCVWEESFHLGKTATMTDLQHSLLHNGRIGGSHPRPYDIQWLEHYESLSEEEKALTHDPRVRDLGVQLSPYCKGGSFASFFEGEANINFNNKFIVLELERLKTKKALQAVVLLLLMYLIDLEMRNADRSQTKLVIIDEAWELLGDGPSASFIEAGYRRARKLNGAFFTATQSLLDYKKSATARAALENADCSFILRMKQESLEEARKLGVVTERDYELMNSLTTHAGVYSEVLVKIGDSPESINRLILDPYTQLLYSTHPDDVSAINKARRDLGLSIHEAINQVLKERKNAKNNNRCA